MSGNGSGAKKGRNTGLWIFIGAGLLVAILLGVFVAPWASSNPDGLDKTAEEKGFVKKAEETEPAWKHSPMADYAMPGVKNEKVSTGISGLVGVLMTAAIMVALALLVGGYSLLKKRKAAQARTTIET